MQELKKEMTSNLKSYYNFVVSCRICSRKFGTDSMNHILCPICDKQHLKILRNYV